VDKQKAVEELEAEEELVEERKRSTDLLVRPSAGGVARVTVLKPPVKAVICLM
jgi:hypothetical protein